MWWFDDTDGDELGVWRRQPLAGGPDEEALPGVPRAYPAGLELGSRLAVAGCSGDEGSSAYVVRPGEHDAALPQRARRRRGGPLA